MTGFRAHAGQTTASALETLRTTAAGLTSVEASSRLAKHGPNRVRGEKRHGALALFAKQLASPLSCLLIFASVVSLVTHAYTDAAIVLGIVAFSTVLSFAQEFRAARAVAALSARVVPRARTLRDGVVVTIPSESLVLGDVLELTAGSLVPADALVIASNGCLVDEAILTGETFPVTKRPAVVVEGEPFGQCFGVVFAGTNVRSGTATVVVVAVGAQTEFGKVAKDLAKRLPDTEFEHGIREFGIFVSKIVALLVGVVFVLDVITEKSPIDALLFAIAIAVGMAPELLPAVVTLTLSYGARHMASRGVIVRRLSAIQNLGSMDVLCTDKTGTLTEGVVTLEATLDALGAPSERPLTLAYVNAHHESGFANPIDEAIVACAQARHYALPTSRKLGEIPYDFTRKRLGVVYAEEGAPARIVVKGAFAHVLEVCSHVRLGDELAILDDARRADLHARADDAAALGMRALGIAEGSALKKARYDMSDEHGLVFEGFLLFADPPKRDVTKVLGELRALGVSVKVITGDSLAAARHLVERVGLSVDDALTSRDIASMSDAALQKRASATSLFAEVDPSQKERIVLALRRAGHCVGYMGDGINDAPALHAADVGISVESAVDVAKESADLVLLRRDLAVLRDGIEEGRRTFTNTMKYIYTTTSANFGNMLSLAFASAFLPFLPLLAKQILLNNLLSDVPAMTIANDSVDAEAVARPRHFDIVEIRKFMVTFGAVSSLFDCLTFFYLREVVSLSRDAFRTGWFIESLLTELLIVFIVRTRRPLIASRPSAALLVTSVVVALVVIALPYSPVAPALSLVPLPSGVMGAILGISLLYAVVSELTKYLFWRSPRRRDASSGSGALS